MLAVKYAIHLNVLKLSSVSVIQNKLMIRRQHEMLFYHEKAFGTVVNGSPRDHINITSGTI